MVTMKMKTPYVTTLKIAAASTVGAFLIQAFSYACSGGGTMSAPDAQAADPPCTQWVARIDKVTDSTGSTVNPPPGFEPVGGVMGFGPTVYVVSRRCEAP